MPRHACLRLALLSLMVIVGACAAPLEEMTAANRAQIKGAQIERAQIERDEIDRFFDALILESLAEEMPEAWHDQAPELIPGITPEMMLDHQWMAIQAWEMQRLIELMTNPDMPRPRGPR